MLDAHPGSGADVMSRELVDDGRIGAYSWRVLRVEGEAAVPDFALWEVHNGRETLAAGSCPPGAHKLAKLVATGVAMTMSLDANERWRCVACGEPVEQSDLESAWCERCRPQRGGQ